MKKISIKEVLYLIFVRLPITLYGRAKGNLIKVHWGRNLNNFGDCLQPDILRHYGLTPVFSQQNNSEIILAGSILQWVAQSYTGFIIGTGGDDQKYEFSQATILAVRGKLTRQNLSARGKIVLGDPGLLMPLIFSKPVPVRYKLGIVPHFVDGNTSEICKWKQNFSSSDVLFINPLDTPKHVIQAIMSCEVIVSSSLHGLIIADAYGVPNVRFVNRKTMPTNFYDYKFYDYYSSLDVVEQPLEIDGTENCSELISRTTLKPTDKIKQLQSDLDTLMKDVAKQFIREYK